MYRDVDVGKGETKTGIRGQLTGYDSDQNICEDDNATEHEHGKHERCDRIVREKLVLNLAQEHREDL